MASTKTWTTTADFDGGTLANLLSTGDELSLAPVTGTWSSGGNLNTPRRNFAGCGIGTAGLSFGGYPTMVETEEYDGTSWGAGGDLSTGRRALAGCGVETGGLSIGGWGADVGGTSGTTEEYNGTAWGAGGDLNTARYNVSGCGIETGGLSFGGDGALVSTEEYNGTAWGAGGDLSTGRYYLAGCGATETAGLSFGGLLAGTALETTEEYNGTAWGAGGDLSIPRYFNAGCGTQGSGLCFGGHSAAAAPGSTEEYTSGQAKSGTWTEDMDSSGNATWGNVDCNSVGGDVQIRLKTAVDQAGLGAAAWVPATGYYTSFPAVSTAVQNQWLRIEVSLSGGANVQDIEQSYSFGVPIIDYQGTMSLGMQRKLIL